MSVHGLAALLIVGVAGLVTGCSSPPPSDQQLCNQFAAFGQGYYVDIVRPLWVQPTPTALSPNGNKLLADLISLEKLSPTGKAEDIEPEDLATPMQQANARVSEQASKMRPTVQGWVDTRSGPTLKLNDVSDPYVDALNLCVQSGFRPSWYDYEQMVGEKNRRAAALAETVAPQTTAAAPQAASTNSPPVTSTAGSITGDLGNASVGTDIEPGTYTSPGGATCYWAIIFKDSKGQPADIKNARGGGPYRVTLRQGQDFQTVQCGTWTKVE